MPRTCLEVCKFQCLALECALNLEELSRHWGAQWSWCLIEAVASCPSYPSCSVSAGSKATKRCSATGMGDPSSMPRHLKKPLEEFQLAKLFLAFDTIYRHAKPTVTTSLQISLEEASEASIVPAIGQQFSQSLQCFILLWIPLATCHSSAKSSWRSSWRSKSTSPMSLLAEGNVEACMLLILNHICWTSRIQTPTGSCLQRPGLVTIGKSSASACCQLRSEGAFKSRLCRLLTLSKTCKPWLSH